MSNRILENLIEIKQLLKTHKSVMNVEELALFTGMSKSKIYKLTSARMIPFHKHDISSKTLFFEKREIIKWMTSYKVETLNDLDEKSVLSLKVINRK